VKALLCFSSSEVLTKEEKLRRAMPYFAEASKGDAIHSKKVNTMIPV
jgi:hypothetical protein